MRTGKFKASDLRLVAPPPPPDVPPLAVGDHCELNSGSPSFLVVDLDDEAVIVAWPFEERVVERRLPRACVRRKQIRI